MRRTQIVSGLWALSVMSVSCVSGTSLEWPDADVDFAFLYVVPEDGRAPYVSPVPDDRVLPVALRSTDTLYWIGGSQAVFRAEYPGFDIDAGLTLRVGEPITDPLCARFGELENSELRAPLFRERRDHVVLRRSAPDTRTWVEVSELPGEASLEISSPTRPCLDEWALTVEPFSEVEIPESRSRIEQLHAIGPRRALARDASEIWVVDRDLGSPGVGWEPNIALPDLYPEREANWDTGRFGVDPTSPPGGPLRVVVVLTFKTRDDRLGAGVVLVEVDGLDVTHRRTLLLEPNIPNTVSELVDIEFSSSGEWVAAGADLIATATSASATPQLLEWSELRARSIAWTPDDPTMHFLSGDTQGWIGDARRGSEGLRTTSLVPRNGRVLAAAPGPHSEQFFSTTLPAIWRWDGADYDEIPVWVPPEASVCSIESRCGRRLAGSTRGSETRVLSYHPESEALVYGFRSCNAAFVMDLDSACVRSAALPAGAEVEYNPADEEERFGRPQNRASTVAPGGVWIGGRPNLFYTLEFETIAD